MLEHPAQIGPNAGRAGASLGPEEVTLGTFGKGHLGSRGRDQPKLWRAWLPGLFFRTPGRGRGTGTPAVDMQILPVLAPTRPSWSSCVGPAPSSMDGGPEMVGDERTVSPKIGVLPSASPVRAMPRSARCAPAPGPLFCPSSLVSQGSWCHSVRSRTSIPDPRWDAVTGKGIWGQGRQGTGCLWDVKAL